MSQVKPEVKIVLDKERTLKLDLNAMAAYEEATGKSMFKAFNPDELGARELRALLWACLIHEDESLTLKQVGSFITADNMNGVAARIGEAFKSAMPAAEDKKDFPLA